MTNSVLQHALNIENNPVRSFISTWNTSLVSTGSSAANQIKLPLTSTGVYDFIVDWGDGTQSYGGYYLDPAMTHTYAVPGKYKITISAQTENFDFQSFESRVASQNGIFEASNCLSGNFNNLLSFNSIIGFQFANSGDRLKLLSIQQWGPLQLGNSNDYFWGCENLSLSNVSDVLNLSKTTSLYRAFYQCTNLTKINNINKWDTSTITTLNRMFERCINFNDNVGNWNTSNVTDMQNVFASASKFNNDDNNSIGQWDTSKVTTFSYMFGSDSFTGYMVFNQYIGDWNTSNCLNLSYMFFRNPKFNQDIGTKIVKKNGITYLGWDIKNVTTLLSMFSSNGVNIPPGEFNNNNSPNIGNWNTSSVTTFQWTFNTQSNFDQNIGTKEVDFPGGINYIAWDTQNVTSFYAMLYAHPSRKGVFNNGGSGKIGNWNVSNATTMAAMFINQPLFNQNIGTSQVTVGASTYLAWNTVLVTDMSFMFYNSVTDAVFNNGDSSSIGFWDTSKVITMTQMFTGAPFFNQNIGPRVVTDLRIIPYTSWDVGLVRTFNYMFYGFNFPRNMHTFNNAGGTLQGGSNSIQSWNTISATNMSYMFTNNVAFNRPIAWNTSTVTNMTSMFKNAIGFNQNLSALNVSAVTTFGSNTDMTDQFMTLKTFNNFSYQNYDALLIGWASRPVLPNKIISFGTVKYSAAAIAARLVLTSSPNNWTIIDGGQIIL